MHTEEKRFFLGNLPPNVTEENVFKKFKKFGVVKSVEIKHRPDNSTFAFLNFEGNKNAVDSCFHSVRKSKWDGYTVKIEFAKESFLSKLQHERQSDKQDINEREENRNVTKRCKSNDNVKRTLKNSVNVSSSSTKSEEEDDDDGEDEEEDDDDGDEEEEGNEGPKWKLKKFRGTKHFSCESDTKSTTYNVKLNNSEGLLERLESFSKTWKDSDTAPGSNNKYKKERTVITPEDGKTKSNFRNKNVLNQTLDTHKSMLADEKRKKALDEKKKVLQKQREAIKKALTCMDSAPRNKKVKFNDDGDEESIEETKKLEQPASSNKTEKPARKTVLFGDSSDDDEEEDYNSSFKIKSQFEGSEGRKLLELQSRYGNDRRFTLDEKFYESEDDDIKQTTNKQENCTVDDERSQQLAILEQVLGHKVALTEGKRKQKTVRMLRYDPTKAEHTKFIKEMTSKKENIIDNDIFSDDELDTKTRTLDSKSKTKKEAINNEIDITVPVSKEKFYKVADSLKESLKKEQNTFSVRELFSKSDEGLEENDEDDTHHNSMVKKQQQIGWISNPFKYDSSDDDNDEDEKAEVPTDVKLKDNVSQQSQNKFAENFFFVPNDTRFQEGLDFFIGDSSTNESLHDFAKHRRELKHLVRLKVKNKLRNQSQFKKKIGGHKRKMNRIKR